MSDKDTVPLLINKLQMDQFIETEIEQETDKMLETSTDTAIDVELQDLGPQLLKKPCEYHPDNNAHKAENLQVANETGKKEEMGSPEASADAGVHLEMQDSGIEIVPNSTGSNGDSPAAQADGLDVSEKRVTENTLDPLLDIRMPTLQETGNDIVIFGNHFNCELFFYLIVYFTCVIFAFGYAGYYVVMLIIGATASQKSQDETSNE